mmetsp:Transcript_32614/g.75790  ORF Transcript_32614/g.75790 Transcript_32614/m.75790 type:complete len:221 (-) Transcript_32614:222-884(-)
MTPTADPSAATSQNAASNWLFGHVRVASWLRAACFRRSASRHQGGPSAHWQNRSRPNSLEWHCNCYGVESLPRISPSGRTTRTCCGGQKKTSDQWRTKATTSLDSLLSCQLYCPRGSGPKRAVASPSAAGQGLAPGAAEARRSHCAPLSGGSQPVESACVLLHGPPGSRRPARAPQQCNSATLPEPPPVPHEAPSVSARSLSETPEGVPSPTCPATADRR